MDNSSINDDYDKFIHIFTNIVNDSAELKCHTNKLDSESQLWMTKSLIKRCKVKNNLAISKKILWHTYTAFSNKLTNLIRLQKRNDFYNYV